MVDRYNKRQATHLSEWMTTTQGAKILQVTRQSFQKYLGTDAWITASYVGDPGVGMVYLVKETEVRAMRALQLAIIKEVTEKVAAEDGS